MSRNRWHAPYTCMPRVNGRLATIYKASVKAKERSRKREREGKRKAEKRPRERKRERVPRNYARVSYGGTSTAVTTTGPNDSEWSRLLMTACSAFRHQIREWRIRCPSYVEKFSPRLRCWLICPAAVYIFTVNMQITASHASIIVDVRTQSCNLVIPFPTCATLHYSGALDIFCTFIIIEHSILINENFMNFSYAISSRLEFKRMDCIMLLKLLSEQTILWKYVLLEG